MCLQVPGNLGPDGCSPINSIVPYFFGESASGVYMRTMLDASRILSSRGLYQYLDKEFVPERAYSKSFRTNIAIGERKKEWKAWMRNVLMPFLEQNTANATLQVRAVRRDRFIRLPVQQVYDARREAHRRRHEHRRDVPVPAHGVRLHLSGGNTRNHHFISGGDAFMPLCSSSKR